jgi:hypothetical protein
MAMFYEYALNTRPPEMVGDNRHADLAATPTAQGIRISLSKYPIKQFLLIEKGGIITLFLRSTTLTL